MFSQLNSELFPTNVFPIQFHVVTNTCIIYINELEC